MAEKQDKNINVNLSVNIAGITFPNPLILASGILGITPGTMLRLQKAGLGGVTTKTVGPRPRKGYRNPSIIELEEGTFLNAVGLANPGIDYFKEEIKQLKEELTIPLIVSIFGDGPEGYAEIARIAEKAGADAIEINVSCPHAEVSAIGLSEDLTYQFTKTVKKAISIPVFVKLTPNIADARPIAKAAEEAGADAIVAINTIRALALDIETGRPLLAHGLGGLSGKAIKPIGVRFVYEIAQAVKIPIIGCGGVSTWEDVIEYMYAGATAVQIGSAFSQGTQIIGEIIRGLQNFLSHKKMRDFSMIIRKAHQFEKELQLKPEESE